ncbi:formate/nitrite transporter family protein [Clostridiales bacterium COT073_COT-073]|nr:formate/nitrite transporter family protein [Clostridiales bacterium COT073_COT-073]
MNEKELSTPAEMLEITIYKFTKKAHRSYKDMILLGFLAGAFIALAGAGADMVAHNLLMNPNTTGLGKMVSGLIFPVGLMLVVFGGADLFTSNCLVFTSVLAKKVTLGEMLLNWLIIYISNFIGSIFVAFLFFQSGELHLSDNLLGGLALKMAYGKIHLSPVEAISLGLLCNVLVCLAVWLANGMKKASAQFMAIFFPIFLFISSGYEHSVANMFYLPLGIFAKSNDSYVAASGLNAEQLAMINWSNMFTHNLLPVTLGNILGGAVFIGGIYFLLYGNEVKTKLK